MFGLFYRTVYSKEYKVPIPDEMQTALYVNDHLQSFTTESASEQCASLGGNLATIHTAERKKIALGLAIAMKCYG